ncbi:xanthine dehydrogenase family protein molybdopterin-binding subunit [Hydrogenophaga crocea]|uniref:Molybdopterin-dependent oxidoreductase n=1 Tax=Hydrogenophaga crocea TaxID=2716225 RepID=A0A6G8IIL6_9BURK|nr:molybdopterin cofactor-binding domain-containing protein [Hydrogenophaga crocea]QIM52878.1 molybdopterin-dependent oxidoreductase [Hydrogenophaga crocea]
MKRRSLLLAGSGLGVSFWLGGCALPVFPKRPAASPHDALGWIHHENGRYTLRLPRAEMGQQIATALRQVAADELGVAAEAVAVRLAGTADLARVRATVGSESVRDFALPLAQACATLREAFARGETHGWRDADPLPPTALRSFRRPAGATPAPGARRPVPRVHDREIVTGAPLYVADVRLPGLLHGRVLRAPLSPELPSRVLGLDERAARAVPGFVALVRDQRLQQAQAEGLGIVARTPGALDRIEAALAVQWGVDGTGDDPAIARRIDVDAHAAQGRLPNTVLDEGRIDPAAPWDLDLRIDVPLAAHAAIEPRAAVAALDAAGVLDLWVGTQDAWYQRDVVGKALGRGETQLRVHPCRVGGAFGGKTICTVELEAALLCEAVRAPVKVQWTRTQEFRQGFHRPPSSHRLRARWRDGRLQDWQHHFASSHILFTAAGVPAWLQRITDVVAGDPGVARGAAPPYRAPRREVRFALARLPVFTGPWRGLGAGPNGLAIESAIDECAWLAGQDPVAFRLAHIGEPRLARVLRAAVQAAPPLPPATAGERRGRGVACGTYKQSSHAAVVADVSVAADGRVRVTRLGCAHDCGHVIDADGVRAQCEGNLVWGLGMALSDALTVADGRVASDSFASAPIPRLDAVPPLHVVLVDEGEPPGGAGETVIVAAAAAIANAVRAATGRRPTRFPLDPAAFAQT